MNTNTNLSKGSWIQLNERRAAGTGSLLLLLTLVGLTICHVQADPILDQEYIAASTGNTIIAARLNTAQTFTVGVNGILTSVDVLIGQLYNPFAASLTLDIRTTTAGGVPTEPNSDLNILTSLTLPAKMIPQSNGGTFAWVTFDVPDFAVTIGQVLAISMRTDAGAHYGDPDDIPFVWNADDGVGTPVGTYTGGGAFARGVSADALTWSAQANTDYSFRTFVDPVPTSILRPPQTQTAEAGSAVGLRVKASGASPLFCVWYLNSTNLISCSTNRELNLTNVQFAQSGAYTVVISNALGSVTSAPAMLDVIAAVERRPVPGVKVAGEAGSLLNVDYTDSLRPTPNWTRLGSVSLTSTSQYSFDVTLPLPPQRFYRAWRTGTPGMLPALSLPGMVPAITLTGNVGDSLRLDYINQFGPIDAWVTLDTVTLTNTSQLYFDVSAPGQPQRLYRIVPSP
jgi:Immunoglobulin I-set domain